MTPPMVCTASSCTTPFARRCDTGTFDLGRQCDPALCKLLQLGFGFPELRQRLSAGIIVKLDELQPCFRDPAFAASHLCHQLSLLALKAGRLALQRQNAGLLYKTVFPAGRGWLQVPG